jgi:hypothetical protein
MVIKVGLWRLRLLHAIQGRDLIIALFLYIYNKKSDAEKSEIG